MSRYIECDRCERYFNSHHALRQHEADSPLHNICDDCGVDFASWNALKEHWVQSPRHDYCQYCDEHFSDEDELEEHYENDHHYCQQCCRVFNSNYGLTEHYRQSGAHHYCVSCDRHFRSASNLQSHMNSSIHRPKDISCPFRGCDAIFVSRSAMFLHLESGSCRSGVDRKVINQWVKRNDTRNVITDPSRLLTDGNNEDIQYYATSRSWNGIEYECYLCHGGYRSLAALNQHLASPRHQQKIYLCPYESCRTRFPTLSALCQHIESEKCGISRLRIVQRTMDNLLGRVNLITM